MEMMESSPYSAGTSNSGASSFMIWKPSSPTTGTAICTPERNPGMPFRNVTTLSTPPAMVMEPMRTTIRAKNMRQPWTKSVATTER